MIIAGICPRHGFWNSERCLKCNIEAINDVPAFLNKFQITDEMKEKGYKYHAEYFPDESRIYDKLHDRRKQGKAIDGNCFKDAGIALKEIKRKKGMLV